nr:hypothetical protein [Desulfovibrio sp.]
MRCPASVVPCLALAAHMIKLSVPSSLPVPSDALTDSELSSLADSLSLKLDVVDGEGMEGLASRPLKGPVVLLLRDGGAVLFVGRVPDKPIAVVIDPMAQPVKQANVPFAALASRWTGHALLLSPRRLAHRHVHALVSMAREYGKDLSAEDLIHAYVLEGREPDKSLFMRMIGDQGLVGHDAPATLDVLAQMTAGLPFLLHCTGGGLLILWQMDGERLEIENPDRPHLGRTWLSRGEVEPLLDGQVTFIKPKEQGVPSLMAPKKKFGLSFFIGEMRHMFASLGEVGAAAVAIQLLGLATPLFFQVIIDTVVTHHALSTLHILGVGMVAAIGFECLFLWLRSYLLLYVTSVIDLRLSIRTFEHLASLPLPFFERNPAGVIIKHMQQPEKIREFLTGRVFGTVLDCVSLVVVLPILFLYAWQLTVVVLLFSGLSAITIVLAMGPFRRRLQDLYAIDGERQAYLVENIRAMPTVKSLSLEKKQRKGWDDRTAVATGMRFRVGRMGISINAFMTVIQQ